MGPLSAPLNRWVALALLVVMGGLWGLQFAMLKLAAEQGLSEIDTLMIALVLLSVIFTAILVVRRETFRTTSKLFVFLAIIGLLGYIFPLLAALHAAPHIPAGILTLIATLSPVVTILVATLMKTEPVSFQRLIAVVLGVVAVLLVLWPEVELPRYGNTYWILVALIVPLCYGIESIYIASNWPRGMTSLQVVTAQTLVATLMLLPVFLIYGNLSATGSNWSGGASAILIFVLAGVIESLIYFYLIEKTGGVFVSFASFISLFAGIAWGIFLFSESHGVMVWFAVAATLVSLFLATSEKSFSKDSNA